MEENKFFRNSDFKINRYFALPQFHDQIIESSKHGRNVLYNQIRLLNNCYYARKLSGDISIKDIFTIYWPEFKKKYNKLLQRKGLIESVEKMINCHNFENGYLYYECPNCNQFYMVGFSCHSRFCPSCGQKYRKQRSVKIAEKCLEIPHRQFVFTIPSQLRDYFQKDHDLLKVLFNSVSQTLNSYLAYKAPKAYKKEGRKLGYIMFLHTFGRDLKWHPHLHVLLAERFITKDGIMKKFDFFCFDSLRKSYQTILFHNIYFHYKNKNNKSLAQELFKLCKNLKEEYKKGLYIYGPKFNEQNTSTRDIKLLTLYITRYASHPAISERRIIKFNKETREITWFYDPHEDDDIKDEEEKKGRQYITEDVFAFMKRLIIHIPDKKFQQIRYYGFYANKYLKKIKPISLFSDKDLDKMKYNIPWINGLKQSFGYDPTLCKCGCQMNLNLELSFFPKRE